MTATQRTTPPGMARPLRVADGLRRGGGVRHQERRPRPRFTSGNEPTALSLALLARADELRGVTLFLPTPSRDLGWYDPGFEESFQIEIGYILPVVREMVAERRCDYNVQTLLVEYGPLDEAPDVALVEVSPPDERGYCSFGASLWNKREQIEMAPLVLAEVNDRLIRTGGENYVPRSPRSTPLRRINRAAAGPARPTCWGARPSSPAPWSGPSRSTPAR